MGIITLTTDFGSRDYFAGAMKGVIKNINAAADIIDISHEIPSHDVWAAAYTIASTYRFYPRSTIHLAVVDPGVGSARRPILVCSDNQYFIGPDNGIFSFVYESPDFSRVIHITAEHYALPVTGSTFHARDIFAPAAAWLSKGLDSYNFGDEITDYVKFNLHPAKTEGGNILLGEVVYIDKFGNCITNVTGDDINRFMETSGLNKFRMQVKDTMIERISDFYAGVERGTAGTVINGNGFIELFVYQGSAAKLLGLKRGDPVRYLFG